MSQTPDVEATKVPDQLNRLVWLDLEMTGLAVDKEVIIEIATVVTDAHLNIIATGPVLAVCQPESYLAGMDDWNLRHHTSSGLVERVRNSNVSTSDAEEQTLAFLQQHVAAGQSPICGNSVCQDRRFLARYMPKLEAFFHYRNLDVSTVKELVRRWCPQMAGKVVKKNAHLALDDILESIDELKIYKSLFFDHSS